MDKRFTSAFLEGLIATSFGNFAVIAFHFLSIMLMTRFVPRDELGMYFLTLAIVSFLTIISGLGLNLTVARFVSGEDEQARLDVVATAIAARVILIAAVGLIFFLAGRLVLAVFDPTLEDYVASIIVLFAVSTFRELFLYLLQGLQQFKEYAFASIVSAVAKTALLVAYRSQLTLQLLISIDIISLAISLCLQLVATHALLLSLSRRNINRSSLKRIARFSAPLYLNDMFGFAHDRSSVILIGIMMNPASVAAYEVALKVPAAWLRLFDSFIVVYFPSLSRLFSQGDRYGVRKLMNSSLVVLSTGIIFLVLVAFLFADSIVTALFSEAYAEISLAFALLMLNFYLRAMSNVLGYTLVAAGDSSAPVKANFVGSAVNIAGSVVLIRAFGYLGAVYALLLMNITTQVLYCLYLGRVGLSPASREYLKPALFFAAAMAIYLAFDRETALFKLLLVGLYLALCWLLIKGLREPLQSVLKQIARPRVPTSPA